jgi:hypothetical protein
LPYELGIRTHHPGDLRLAEWLLVLIAVRGWQHLLVGQRVEAAPVVLRRPPSPALRAAL